MERNSHKKLRKLPHVFGKVLELPFRSDADVAVEEGPDFFRFVVKIKVDGGAAVGDVRAHAVEIHPGVIKIVVRNDHKLSCVELFLDKLELDTWRFRLPSSSLPELATAAFFDGKLVVTVPKGGSRREFVKGGVLPNVYMFPFLPQSMNCI
ncbi:heat shock protein [Perilla frutescens var. hirtella]|uniref:Heat shock protein n=1 Tax=Perilla frutescens var. hirtella TaxID=608512 RepID=A0AAD4IUT8_PERFH|nr:heat shock protein [Perilla frutescens var. hirtella]KAH6821583.1 heat shock protein [Perilla frutescens var. hirtella]